MLRNARDSQKKLEETRVAAVLEKENDTLLFNSAPVFASSSLANPYDNQYNSLYHNPYTLDGVNLTVELANSDSASLKRQIQSIENDLEKEKCITRKLQAELKDYIGIERDVTTTDAKLAELREENRRINVLLHEAQEQLMQEKLQTEERFRQEKRNYEIIIQTIISEQESNYQEALMANKKKVEQLSRDKLQLEEKIKQVEKAYETQLLVANADIQKFQKMTPEQLLGFNKDKRYLKLESDFMNSYQLILLRNNELEKIVAERNNFVQANYDPEQSHKQEKNNLEQVLGALVNKTGIEKLKQGLKSFVWKDMVLAAGLGGLVVLAAIGASFLAQILAMTSLIGFTVFYQPKPVFDNKKEESMEPATLSTELSQVFEDESSDLHFGYAAIHEDTNRATPENNIRAIPVVYPSSSLRQR